ncbi:MAG: hypothetical protein GY820_39020 [Gammaproteobacteria bacterium]|nr:hypothetical protein [Gammaproteobacteria bacterium]
MIIELQGDVEFLLALLPEWAKNPQPGLDPTMYGTGTYDGDIQVNQRLLKLMKKIEYITGTND